MEQKKAKEIVASFNLVKKLCSTEKNPIVQHALGVIADALNDYMKKEK